MFNKRFYYLIKIQYLGYRFHGWQKQPKVKTLHLMIDRTFNYILEELVISEITISIQSL